jgi:hypothetical protein
VLSKLAMEWAVDLAISITYFEKLGRWRQTEE